MLILALDCAGRACAVTVWQDGAVLALAEAQMERGQDARLLPLILEQLKQAAVEFPQLDRIAVTRGPGSFTGLRIGLAAAQGLGLAAHKPVIGIDRFSLYRAQQPKTDNLLVVLDSKRQELFCRFYPPAQAPEEPRMLAPDEIMQSYPATKFAGDAAALLPQAVFLPLPQPEVVGCAMLAAAAARDDPAYAPLPYYLRAPDVTLRNPPA